MKNTEAIINSDDMPSIPQGEHEFDGPHPCEESCLVVKLAIVLQGPVYPRRYS